MTYNPFFELFYEGLNCLISYSQNNELSKTASFLEFLYNINITNLCELTISAPYFIKEMSFILPKRNEISLYCATFFSQVLFSAVPDNILYDILCFALLEKSIIFISQDLNLLTNSMYFYKYIK